MSPLLPFRTFSKHPLDNSTILQHFSESWKLLKMRISPPSSLDLSSVFLGPVIALASRPAPRRAAAARSKPPVDLFEDYHPDPEVNNLTCNFRNIFGPPEWFSRRRGPIANFQDDEAPLGQDFSTFLVPKSAPPLPSDDCAGDTEAASGLSHLYHSFPCPLRPTLRRHFALCLRVLSLHHH